MLVLIALAVTMIVMMVPAAFLGHAPGWLAAGHQRRWL
jgi:hypothetical protein